MTTEHVAIESAIAVAMLLIFATGMVHELFKTNTQVCVIATILCVIVLQVVVAYMTDYIQFEVFRFGHGFLSSFASVLLSIAIFICMPYVLGSAVGSVVRDGTAKIFNKTVRN